MNIVYLTFGNRITKFTYKRGWGWFFLPYYDVILSLMYMYNYMYDVLTINTHEHVLLVSGVQLHV